MVEIFRSEFLRYRKWAFLVTAVLLAVFTFIARLEPFLDPGSVSMALVSVALLLASLAFGFAQMMLHRRSNHWTYLVHRPTDPRHIYLGLMLAGFAILAIAVAAPWAVMITGLDISGASVVDTRHYAYVVYFYLICAAAYLVGNLAVLSANRGAILLTTLLFILLLPSPDNSVALFLPAFVLIALFITLNILSFKPDLGQHFRRPWAIALMVLPLCVPLMYGLSMSSTLTYHVPRFLMGTHPDTNPVDGTFRYYWNLDAAERVDYVLKGSEHPQSNYYIRQATLADDTIISTRSWPFPYRGQMFVKDFQYALVDEGSNTVWQFSHDSMLLEGRHVISQKSVGAVGRNGFLDSIDDATDADRFEVVPVMVGDNLMITPEILYQVDFAERYMAVKHQPAAGERYFGAPQFEEHYVALVTDKRVLLFDRQEFADEYQPAEPEYSVPHPVNPNGIYYVQTYRMVDGYLMVYSGPSLLGFDKSGTIALYARLGGGAELIHQRSYDIYAHPSWIRHMTEIASPVTLIAYEWTLDLIDPNFSRGNIWTWERVTSYPGHIYWLIVVLQLGAALGVFLLARRHELNGAQTATWVAMAFFLGLPALAGFLLMNPWRVTWRGRTETGAQVGAAA